jgi:hypothetical protein
MVPAQLQRHLHTKHADCKDKPIASLNVKQCHELKQSQTNLTSFINNENGNMCEASQKVSYHIAHCVKPTGLPKISSDLA